MGNAGLLDRLVKGKPAERQGRKATGPRPLPDAFRDAFKDPKTAGLPNCLASKTQWPV